MNHPAIFAGAALTATSIGITSGVLTEIGKLNTTVGVKTDLGLLNPANPINQEGLILAIFLILVAIIGKMITGLTEFGKPGMNRLAVGVGMIHRGEVGLVFVSVGAASGMLDKPTEAAIIMMVIVTTFLAPSLLRLVFQDKFQEMVEVETKS